VNGDLSSYTDDQLLDILQGGLLSAGVLAQDHKEESLFAFNSVTTVRAEILKRMKRSGTAELN
jgi:hypothetical protein